MQETNLNNINAIERVLRLFIGSSLIGSVMLVPIPFDYLILMPLLGIYPCLTGIVGWDPVYFVLGKEQTKIEKLIDERITQLGTTSLLRPRAI